jgi:hypothetical protein
MKASHVAIMAALSCMVLSCGDNDGNKGARLALSCVESGDACLTPIPTQGSANADSLYLCNYWDSTHNFQVEFDEGSTRYGVQVLIANFTGAGTYETNTDGTTNVWITTNGAQGDAAGNPPSIPEHKCTIVATSNLAEITIPQNGDADILDVKLTVSCPNGLGWGNVCAIACTVNPSTFHLSVKGCTVSQ